MRRANRVLTDILSLFNRRGYEVTVHMTAGPGDGASVVEALAGSMDLVVCAGGDGTFNETVTGLLRSGADAPVGYIPCGSTNDFANSLKLPVNVLPGRPGRCRTAFRCPMTWGGLETGIFPMWRPSARLPRPPTRRRRT
ncbi:MAG: acylglycerol kinase family protein [Oscillospiraceae bacterium]